MEFTESEKKELAQYEAIHRRAYLQHRAIQLGIHGNTKLAEHIDKLEQRIAALEQLLKETQDK